MDALNDVEKTIFASVYAVKMAEFELAAERMSHLFETLEGVSVDPSGPSRFINGPNVTLPWTDAVFANDRDKWVAFQALEAAFTAVVLARSHAASYVTYTAGYDDGRGELVAELITIPTP